MSTPKGRSASFPMVQLQGLAGGTVRHTGAGKCLFLAVAPEQVNSMLSDKVWKRQPGS